MKSEGANMEGRKPASAAIPSAVAIAPWRSGAPACSTSRTHRRDGFTDGYP